MKNTLIKVMIQSQTIEACRGEKIMSQNYDSYVLELSYVLIIFVLIEILGRLNLFQGIETRPN